MRGGGWNSDNTQVSNGRRMPLHKCRDCDNVVRAPRAILCADCNFRAFENRQKLTRARIQHQKQKHQPEHSTAIDNLSRGLIGLQRFWLSHAGGIST